MQNAGGNDFSLDQFEYCYLVEDTDPCATQMKIYVPKLMGQKTGSANTNQSGVDQTSFMNSGDCPGNCVNLVHGAQTCCPGTSDLKVCHHFHHDHHFPHEGDKGLIPKGSRLICMFMNHDPNDCIVTRMEVMFPNGQINPMEPADEHR